MKSWQFIHINDTQPGSPRSFRFKPALLENQAAAYRQVQQLQPELLLVGGDVTRDGSIHDFELHEAHQRLAQLDIPFHVIPGNMDTGNKHTRVQSHHQNRDDLACNVTFNQLQNFAHVFGNFPWTFIHRNVRFTGFYAAVAGSGLPQEQIFWDFLDTLPTLPKAVHHVVMMHYALFMDQMNEPAFDITLPSESTDWYFSIDHPHRERIFEKLKEAGVSLVLSGHIHCRRPVQNVAGVNFLKTPATSFGQAADRWPDGDTTLGFTRFEVTDESLTPLFVPLETVSTRQDGYGPGGHPKLEARDYSLAWEKRP